MNTIQCMTGVVLGLSLLGGAGRGALGAGAATRPSVVKNGWSEAFFVYDRPAKLVVEEATPSEQQVDWHGRPAQMKAGDATPADKGRARPRRVDHMNVLRLRFTDADGEVVPVLLYTPADKAGPYPVVVAVHGVTSNKAQVGAQVAPALTKRGFAVLAPDLPRHGERPGEPRSVMDASNPRAAFTLARRAVIDVRQCIDLAEARADLDTREGVTLVGYSLGSWISSVAGPADPRVEAMALMVGGALDIPRMALLLPQVAATDVRLSIAHFAGRPLLLLNGRQDRTVPKEMADRLFAACPEPKKQVWYDCGHLLTNQAYEDAADWVAQTTAARLADHLKPAGAVDKKG